MLDFCYQLKQKKAGLMAKKLVTVLIVIIAFMTITTSAYAKDIHLTYNVYAGGFQAMEAKLSFSGVKKTYEIKFDATTKGTIGKLFPWRGIYETEGLTGAKTTPRSAEAISVWDGESKKVEMRYDSKGNIISRKINGKSEKLQNRTELSKDTVDMLTATLIMLQSVEKKSTCNGKVPVFDGKRRFNINFKEDGKITVKPSKYSIFSGEAMRCVVTVEPVAGFRERDKKRGWLAVQEHSKSNKALPTLFVARRSKHEPYVPVRMEIKSSYGAVIAHLTGIDIKK
jgi:hypothetical protein